MEAGYREILLVNESNSVMTEYARVTFSTVALMMSSLGLHRYVVDKTEDNLSPCGAHVLVTASFLLL